MSASSTANATGIEFGPPLLSAPRPGWLVTVWIATALYLLIEFSFNARLLDVVGGSATVQQIDRIELWGRAISGFALALLFWPKIIARAWLHFGSLARRLWSIVAWTLVAMLVMYVAQEAFLRWLVSRASPDAMQQAQHLVLLRSSLHHGNVALPGLDVPRSQLSEPDGKAFMAMFPMLGSGLGPVVGNVFGATQREQATASLVRREMGDPNRHLDGYRELLTGLQTAYTTYGEALAEIDQAGHDAWGDYVRALRKRGYSPGSVPRRGHARVRNQVRRDGVHVPDSWRPNDRAGFIAAATAPQRNEASRRFAGELATEHAAFRGISPPDSLGELLREPDGQTRVLRAMGYRCLTTFDTNLPTAEAFKVHVYDAEVECLKAETLAAQAEPQAGRDAMRALLIPAIALSLSLLGALAHVGKLALLTLKLVLGRPPARARLIGVAVLAGPFLAFLLFASLPLSAITRTQLYVNLEARLPAPLALVLRGTIHGQHVGYPLFNATRVHVLRGFTFGYEDAPTS